MKGKRKILVLSKALKELSFAAQITGGTAGPDKELMTAIDHAGIVLDTLGLYEGGSDQ